MLLSVYERKKYRWHFRDRKFWSSKRRAEQKTIAIRSLLDGQSEAVTQTAIIKAPNGDSIALRLCMERIAPAPKDQPVSFNLPKMNNALDASEVAGSVGL